MILRFSKGSLSHNFHPISTKLYGKHDNEGGIQANSFLGDPPKIKKKFWYFEIFVNTGPYRAANFIMGPTVFIRFQPNFMRTLATMGEYRMLLVLAISQVLQNLWHFEIFTWESMGNPNMCKILKTADRGAKRMKIWGLWSCEFHNNIDYFSGQVI